MKCIWWHLWEQSIFICKALLTWTGQRLKMSQHDQLWLVCADSVCSQCSIPIREFCSQYSVPIREILAKTAADRRRGFLGICKTVRNTTLWWPITVSSGLQVGVGVCGGVGAWLRGRSGQKSKQPLVDWTRWSVNHRCCHGRLEIQ